MPRQARFDYEGAFHHIEVKKCAHEDEHEEYSLLSIIQKREYE